MTTTKFKTLLFLFIAFNCYSIISFAQTTKVLANQVKVVFPKKAVFLTSGYFLDSLRKFKTHVGSVLASPSNTYYEADGVYFNLSVRVLEDKRTMDQEIEFNDFWSEPNKPKGYEILSFNGNRYIVRYSETDQSISINSIDTSGFVQLYATIYSSPKNYEKAKIEAKRLAQGSQFLPYKPEQLQSVQIKELLRFQIPEKAVKIKHDQYIKMLKDSSYYISFIPPVNNNQVLYHVNNLTVSVISWPISNSKDFQNRIKFLIGPVGGLSSSSNQKKELPRDHSYQYYAGRKVFVTTIADPNELYAMGSNEDETISYTIQIYMKPKTRAQAYDELKRLVKSIEFSNITSTPK